MKISEVLGLYRRQAEVVQEIEPGWLLRTVHVLMSPVKQAELPQGWGEPIPAELLEFWRNCAMAGLFYDFENGQGGLKVGSPRYVRGETDRNWQHVSEDMRDGDLVIATLVGEDTFILHSPSDAPARRYLAGEPLNQRSDWFALGDSLAELLRQFFVHDGDNFWDVNVENPDGHQPDTCVKCQRSE